MWPPGRWSEKDTPVVVTTPSIRDVSHTVLGAIIAKFVNLPDFAVLKSFTLL